VHEKLRVLAEQSIERLRDPKADEDNQVPNIHQDGTGTFHRPACTASLLVFELEGFSRHAVQISVLDLLSAFRRILNFRLPMSIRHRSPLIATITRKSFAILHLKS
jgi:hypothetical protein